MESYLTEKDPKVESNGALQEDARGADTAAQGETAIQAVATSDIDVFNETYAMRFSYDLSELKDSVARDGILIPLTLVPAEDPDSPHRYIILCGQTRARAAVELGLETVPAIVRTGLTKEQKFRLAWLDNEMRRDVSDSEKTGYIHKMLDSGMIPKEIQHELSISERTFQRLNQVRVMEHRLQRLYFSNALSLRHALAIHGFQKETSGDIMPWIELATGPDRIPAKEFEDRIREAKGKVTQHKVISCEITNDGRGIKLPAIKIGPDSPTAARAQAVRALREALAILEAAGDEAEPEASDDTPEDAEAEAEEPVTENV